MEEKVGGIPAELQPILSSLEDIFAESSTLLPHRAQDHHIPLVPNSYKPTHVRNYRQKHIQKNEIEKIVKEMLESGIIQPSTSSFASLILLVKKKDWS